MTRRTILCGVAVALVAGCSDYDAPRRTASIRQSTQAPKQKAVIPPEERGRASISDQCAKRHQDRAFGIFDETLEEACQGCDLRTVL